MSASHAGIPWLQKVLQNWRRASSVSAAARCGMPSMYANVSRNLESDMERAFASKEDGCVLAMAPSRMKEIRDWYDERCVLARAWELPEPAFCPDEIYERHALGAKFVGELLRHIDAVANSYSRDPWGWTFINIETAVIAFYLDDF